MKRLYILCFVCFLSLGLSAQNNDYEITLRLNDGITYTRKGSIQYRPFKYGDYAWLETVFPPDSESDPPLYEPLFALARFGKLVYLIQDPAGFGKIASSCFSTEEIKTLHELETNVAFVPLISNEGKIISCDQFYLYNYNSQYSIADADIDVDSLKKIEKAAIEYFTFNDGGLFNKCKADRLSILQITLKFQKDGNIKVSSQYDWIEKIDPKWIRNDEKVYGLDYNK